MKKTPKRLSATLVAIGPVWLLLLVLAAPTTAHAAFGVVVPRAGRSVVGIGTGRTDSLHPRRRPNENDDVAIIPSRILGRRDAPPMSTRTRMASSSRRAGNDSVVAITFPTPDEAAAMGCRDWPQQFKMGTWTESVPEGQIFTRYVLEGKGRVEIAYDDDAGSATVRKERVSPGTLLEVDGGATVVWTADDDKNGMIILTPGFEEGGKLAAVAVALVALCAALIAGVGGS